MFYTKNSAVMNTLAAGLLMASIGSALYAQGPEIPDTVCSYPVNENEGAVVMYAIDGTAEGAGKSVVTAELAFGAQSYQQAAEYVDSRDFQVIQQGGQIPVVVGIPTLTCLQGPSNPTRQTGALRFGPRTVDVNLLCASIQALQAAGFSPEEVSRAGVFSEDRLNAGYEALSQAVQEGRTEAVVVHMTDPNPFQMRHGAVFTQVLTRHSELLPLGDHGSFCENTTSRQRGPIGFQF